MRFDKGVSATKVLPKDSSGRGLVSLVPGVTAVPPTGLPCKGSSITTSSGMSSNSLAFFWSVGLVEGLMTPVGDLGVFLVASLCGVAMESPVGLLAVGLVGTVAVDAGPVGADERGVILVPCVAPLGEVEAFGWSCWGFCCCWRAEERRRRPVPCGVASMVVLGLKISQ